MKYRSLLFPTLGLTYGAFAAAGLVRRYQRRFDFRDRSVVIGGGSRGLGLAIARRLARRGARLALFATDAEELARAQSQLEALGAKVLIFAVDARDASQVERAMNSIIAAWGRIDALFNVQGTIQVGPVGNLSREMFEEAMAVNYDAAFNLIWAVLPHMRRNRAGRIINVSSIGGEIAVPHLAAYSASKFALTGLSMALHTELRKHGIHVTTICPTLMRTGSAKHADVVGRRDQEAAWFTTMSSIPGLSMNVERAAARIIAAASSGRATSTLSLQGRLATIASRLFPETFADVLALVDRALPEEDLGEGTYVEKAGDVRASVQTETPTPEIPGFAAQLTESAVLRNNE